MGIDVDKVTNPKFLEALQEAEAAAVPPRLKAPHTPGPAPTGKRKGLPKMPEIRIHDHIVAFCDRNGIVPVHPDPSRKSTIRTGYPDFFCCRDGRVIAIEIKVWPNTLSKAQQYEFPRIEACGIQVHICSETEPGTALQKASNILRDFFGIDADFRIQAPVCEQEHAIER